MAELLLPLALFTIMLGLGLGLTPAHFAAFRHHRRLLVLAWSGQLLALPLLVAGLVSLSGLAAPLAAGLVIVALAPGGATSNLISHLCRGDTALSVTLTAFSSLITPLSLPLLTSLVLWHFTGETRELALPVVPTLFKLASITLVPVLLGMALRRRFQAWAEGIQPGVRLVSLVFMVVTVTGLAVGHWDAIAANLASLLPVVLLMVVLAMLLGALLGRLGGGSGPQQLTVAVEVGIQNAGVALVVTDSLLNNAAMTTAVLSYGIFMQIPALMLVAWTYLRFLPRFRTQS